MGFLKSNYGGVSAESLSFPPDNFSQKRKGEIYFNRVLSPMSEIHYEGRGEKIWVGERVGQVGKAVPVREEEVIEDFKRFLDFVKNTLNKTLRRFMILPFHFLLSEIMFVLLGIKSLKKQ